MPGRLFDSNLVGAVGDTTALLPVNSFGLCRAAGKVCRRCWCALGVRSYIWNKLFRSCAGILLMSSDEPDGVPPAAAAPPVGEAAAPNPGSAVAVPVAASADANDAGDPDSMMPPAILVGGAEPAHDHSSSEVHVAPDGPSVGQELTSASPKKDDGTASQDAMQHEEQKDEDGNHADDDADDAVVDLLDSDDEDGEAFTSGTGQQQPRVGDAGVALPSSPPAAPGGGVGVAAVPPPPPPAAAATTGGGGNDYSDDSDIEIVGTTAAPAPPPPPQQQHLPRLGVAPSGAAVAARAPVIPEWMQKAAAEALAAGIPANSREFNNYLSLREQDEEVKKALTRRLKQLQYELYGVCQRGQESADNGECNRSAAEHVDNVPGHIPTWEFPVPFTRQDPQRQRYVPSTRKANAFKLSLLSCSDFTISPIQHPDDWSSPRGSLAGLRIHIKKAAKPHGGAKFERADDDGGDDDDHGDSTEGIATVGPAGRWRIPLGAYESLVGYLASLRDERGRSAYVEGIDQRNLQMATMGRELKSKAYPSAQALIDEGVPSGISKALAPYQRGGVDFALHQDGRVLIADEMGLGKTIQAIAAMSAYATEWPLIVFSPSSARYHWQVEFNHWLGEDSVVNKPRNDNEGVDIASGVNGIANDDKSPSGDTDGDAKMSSFDEKKDDDDDGEVSANLELSSEDPMQRKRSKSPVPPMQLLRKSQVNVLTSSKDPLFPTADTQVVICSYGLAPNLIESGKIKKGMFKCAIVDESHMLKNKNTKRSRTILPILMKTTRCLMLSGTPALSRPMELWPQLSVLGNDRGWWNDESDFVRKYVNREEEAGGGGSALAELHTLLTSTVMIRRMKVDMLKNLPKKERHNARIRVTDEALKDEFDRSMAILREGKGALGKLAREHQKEEDERKKEADAVVDASSNGSALNAGENTSASLPTIDIESVRYDAERKRQSNIEGIRHHLMTEFWNGPNLSSQRQFFQQLYNQRVEQEVTRINQEHEQFLSTVKAGSVYNNCRVVDKAAEEEQRKTILNHLYSLTGKAKVGHVVEMLNAWLDDPTKGKLCIFAHHIDILDEITKGAGLSNAAGSLRKYIRIDGKTSPKARQEQMMEFQSDPTVRIAILGITAAGVAITLTAASTVWFAELFWTPAIMIQAEDRCHRIGQQAIVKCLYIIAKGTLDEVLWKLVEKKFRQLGEFVEGKENLDIVVHQTFDCGLKAIAIEDGDDDEDDEEEDDDNDGGADGPKKKRWKRQRTSSFGDLADEDSIQHDIEELAKEEEAMLNIGFDDDDDNNGDAPVGSNSNAAKSADGNNRGGGRNTDPEKKKTAVICLDDSDDEAEASKKKCSSDNASDGTGGKSAVANSSSPNATGNANQWGPPIADSINAIIKSGDYKNGKVDRRARFDNLELYSVLYTGSTYGLSIVPFAGRAVVKSSATISNLSPEQNARPACGDFIVKVGDAIAPFEHPFRVVLQYMQNVIQRHNGLGLYIIFGHDPEFSRFFQETVLPAENQGKEEECRRIEEQLASFAAASAPEAAAEAEVEARTPMASAPLPAPPAVSANAPATTSNFPPEQDDEVIELLDD